MMITDKLTWPAVAIVMAMTMPLSTSATETGGNATDTINGTPVTLDEVNVLGYRHVSGPDLQSRPIFTISSERIAETNPQTSADLLTADGRLTVQKSQMGGGSPSIRGFESSRILLLVDGVRMNNLIYRAGHLQNVITIDPNAIEKVDILYGPSSVVYGSDALGGALAFHTKNPVFADKGTLFKGTACLRYGSVNDEAAGHLEFNIAGTRLASYTSLSFSRFGDLRSGRNKNPFLNDDEYIYRRYDVAHTDGKDVLIANPRRWDEINSGYIQYDLLQKFRIRQSDRIQHGINFQFSNTTDIPRYDRLTDMKDDKPKFAQWYYGPQRRIMGVYTLTLNDCLGADVASVAVSYQNILESRHNRKLDNPWLGNRNERVNIAALNADWIKRIGNHSITVGLDGSLQFLKSTANSVDINTGEIKPLDTRYPDGNNHMHNIELFAVHRYTINDKWTLNDGLRVGFSSLRSTFESREFYSFLTDYVGTIRQDNPVYCANIGVNYMPSSEWNLALDVSTGYRVPNIDDLAKVFDSQPGMVVMPNPDIRPEKTVGANFHVSFLHGRAVEWEASIFGTYMFDAIALAPALFNGQDKIMYDGEMSDVYSSRNNRLAYVSGVSTALTVRLSRHFKADGAVTYTYGNILGNKNERKMPLDHVAPLFGRVGVTYTSTGDKVNAEVYSLFNGSKPLSRYNMNGEDNIGYATEKGADGKGLPAWFTLNLRVSFRPNPAITLQGGIENILDTEYRTFGSGINAPGRNFYAAIRTAF